MASSSVTPLPKKNTLFGFFQKQVSPKVILPEVKKDVLNACETQLSAQTPSPILSTDCGNTMIVTPSPVCNLVVKDDKNIHPPNACMAKGASSSPNSTIGRPPLPSTIRPLKGRKLPGSTVLKACSIFPQEVTKKVDSITELTANTATPISADAIDRCYGSTPASDAVTVVSVVAVLPSVILTGSVTPAAKVPMVPAKRGRKSTVSPASVPAVKKSRTARSAKSAVESASDASANNESQGDDVSGRTSPEGAEHAPSASVGPHTVSMAMSMETSSDFPTDAPTEITEFSGNTVSAVTGENTAKEVCEQDNISVNEVVVVEEVREQDITPVTDVVPEAVELCKESATPTSEVVEVEEKLQNEKKPAPVESKRRKRTAAVMLNIPAKETETLISPEVAVKIKCHTERMAEMIAELASLEKLPDVCDIAINVEEAISGLTNPCTAPADGTLPTIVTSEDSAAEMLKTVEDKINQLIAVSVQGSADSLSVLVPLVAANIRVAVLQLEDTAIKSAVIYPTPSSPSSPSPSSPPSHPSSSQLSSSSPVSDPSSALIDLSEDTNQATDISAPVDESTLEPVTTLVSEEWRTAALSALTKLSDPVILAEKIKTIAERQSYGTRGKGASLFEDTDPLSLWRWETVSNAYFSKTQVTVRSVAKAARSRYGRCIKASTKIIEQLLKAGACAEGGEGPKIAILEEAAAKAQAEVAKSKEKRREMDRIAEERSKKEALKELLREKKEEAALIEKKEKAAEKEREKEKEKEKKEKQPSEKEIKQAAGLEKQRNCMLGFFNTPKVLPPNSMKSSTSLPTRVLSSRASLGGPIGSSHCYTHSSTSASASSSFISSATSSSSSSVADSNGTRGQAGASLHTDMRIVDLEFENSFELSLSSQMTLGEISRSFRERYKNGACHPLSVPRGKLRPRKLLSVTVSVAGNAFSQGPEVYSELKDVSVDSRMRMHYFSTDTRPPYNGTFSRTSRVLTGRRPFEKDHKLFNYDYDSEAEWEEGDGEGEDIGESDDEDDGEGNELEYDDFLRQDNDFGSDADSDGEGASAASIQRREGMETLGPRFLSKYRANSGTRCAIKLDSAFSAVSCSDREKDVVRLGAYTAVVYAQPAMLPFLGGDPLSSTASGANTEKKVKTKPTIFDDVLQKELAEHIHGSKKSIDKLIASFVEIHPTASKAQARRHFVEIAEKEKHPSGHGSLRWIVKEEVRKRSGIDHSEDIFTPQKKKRTIVPILQPTAQGFFTASPSVTTLSHTTVSANASVQDPSVPKSTSSRTHACSDDKAEGEGTIDLSVASSSSSSSNPEDARTTLETLSDSDTPPISTQDTHVVADSISSLTAGASQNSITTVSSTDSTGTSTATTAPTVTRDSTGTI